MSDYAHKRTDEVLEKLETRIAVEYRKAYRETKAKLDDYLDAFKEKDAKMRKKWEDGKITREEYRKWRKRQIATGERWRALVKQLAADYTNADKIAVALINGEISGVFALNGNYTAYEIERNLGASYGFTLYDKQTVARLVKENPELLPAPSVDIAKDFRWNRQKITSAITQAILQGESIPNVAKRLQRVADMDNAAAVRNARTAMTSAQNAGRQETYNQAMRMGLKLQKEWVATLDGRTRHEHGAADGQRVGLDEPFVIGGYKMMFPGDSSAPGRLVYNCRCTMITVEPEYITRGEKARTTFPEWAKEKGLKGW